MELGQGLCDPPWALPFSGLGSPLVQRAVDCMLPCGGRGEAQCAGMGPGERQWPDLPLLLSALQPPNTFLALHLDSASAPSTPRPLST